MVCLEYKQTIDFILDSYKKGSKLKHYYFFVVNTDDFFRSTLDTKFTSTFSDNEFRLTSNPNEINPNKDKKEEINISEELNITLGYSEITTGNLPFRLIGLSRSSSGTTSIGRFLEILSNSSFSQTRLINLGYIILVNGSDSDNYNKGYLKHIFPNNWTHHKNVKAEINELTNFQSNAHFIIAVFNHSLDQTIPLERLHDKLQIEDNISIVGFDFDNRKSILDVVSKLVKTSPKNSEFIDVINFLEKTKSNI